jgi:hypothetical protein
MRDSEDHPGSENMSAALLSNRWINNRRYVFIPYAPWSDNGVTAGAFDFFEDDMFAWWTRIRMIGVGNPRALIGPGNGHDYRHVGVTALSL